MIEMLYVISIVIMLLWVFVGLFYEIQSFDNNSDVLSGVIEKKTISISKGIILTFIITGPLGLMVVLVFLSVHCFCIVMDYIKSKVV